MKNSITLDEGVCKIALRRGGKKGTEFIYAIIDPSDLGRVDEYQGTWTPKWNPTAQTFYARSNDPKVGYMHRWILKVTDRAIQVDHNDHNGLNNRRNNMIKTCVMGNGFNRRGAERGCKSGKRNVYWNQREQKWMVWVVFMGERHYIGYFAALESADIAARELRFKLTGKEN